MKETNRNRANVAKRRARQRKLRNRRIALTVCLMLVVMVASIGGTVAWLTAKTDPVVNTFTTSDIKIKLEETKTNFKMVPGCTIEKDPKVTVEAGSEACWLFVKVEKANDLDNYISYAMADGWTELTEGSGIYWRSVTATEATSGVTYSVLAGDTVTVKDTVTKDMMETAKTSQPTLKFTAYAVQSAHITDVNTAWTEASK